MAKYLTIIIMLLLITFSAVGTDNAEYEAYNTDTDSQKTEMTFIATGADSALSAMAGTKKDKQTDAMNNPEQDSTVMHHRHFRHRIKYPANPSGDIVVLLHGSGGDEATLFPFANPIWPRAILVGVRGRVVQDGEIRWYRKITPVRFDEKDVEREADALVHFLTKLADKKHYDMARITFVGYSNGANLLAVMMMKHPDLVRRAVLMRSMPVLDPMPAGALRKARILTVSGKNDTLYSPFARALSAFFRRNGARVESHMIEADHMIDENDARIVSRWLENQDPESISAISRATGKN